MTALQFPLEQNLTAQRYVARGADQRPVFANSLEFARHAARDNAPLLVLGGTVNLPRFEWHHMPARRCSAVVLVGQVSAADMAAVQERMPDPAVPIADFAGNREVRSDVSVETFNEETLTAAIASVAPIVRRLGDVPARTSREDRDDLHILRMAYSRDCALEARLAPGVSTAIHYPLVAGLSCKRLALEGLALRNLLRRRHFMRTHACERCASHRLLAFEACNGCGGSDLVDEPLVHHYRCGCQQPESDFLQGNALVCPKCRRMLKHFGMDYGKPGSVVYCRSCGTCAPEPDPRFVCLDCSKTTSGHGVRPMDWFHYDLTEAGLAAIRNGALPAGTDVRLRESGLTPCSMREFHLLASAALRSARKFGHDFSIARCIPADQPDSLRTHGSSLSRDLLVRASHHIAQALADSEFVAAATDCLLIGLPDGDVTAVDSLLDTACAAVTAETGMQFDLKAELHSEEAAARLLESY